jgi:hypothetical protein
MKMFVAGCVAVIVITFACVALAVPKGGVAPHEPNKEPHCTVLKDCHRVCRPVYYGGVRSLRCHRVCKRTLKCS